MRGPFVDKTDARSASCLETRSITPGVKEATSGLPWRDEHHQCQVLAFRSAAGTGEVRSSPLRAQRGTSVLRAHTERGLRGPPASLGLIPQTNGCGDKDYMVQGIREGAVGPQAAGRPRTTWRNSHPRLIEQDVPFSW